jgi:hypothetical protein
MMDIIVVPMLGAASDKWPLNLSMFRRMVKDAGLRCAPAVNSQWMTRLSLWSWNRVTLEDAADEEQSVPVGWSGAPLFQVVSQVTLAAIIIEQCKMF